MNICGITAAYKMKVNELNKVTSAICAKGHGDIEVAINHATFSKVENGTILLVERASLTHVRGADDSGPTKGKFNMLVLSGE